MAAGTVTFMRRDADHGPWEVVTTTAWEGDMSHAAAIQATVGPVLETWLAPPQEDWAVEVSEIGWPVFVSGRRAAMVQWTDDWTLADAEGFVRDNAS